MMMMAPMQRPEAMPLIYDVDELEPLASRGRIPMRGMLEMCTSQVYVKEEKDH